MRVGSNRFGGEPPQMALESHSMLQTPSWKLAVLFLVFIVIAIVMEKARSLEGWRPTKMARKRNPQVYRLPVH